MYAPYFGLRQTPFSIAPDPRYLFMSERHREALAHLLYGLSCGGGFVLLTGEIGTGKTTVCRSFLEQIPPHCDLAYIFNPKLTALELLQSICEEFHIAVPPPREGMARTVKDYIDPLNAFLLQAHAQGRNSVLIIDEAQNLAPEVLEQLRLLTNLETNERKLLQIILIGQPELRDMLARPELEQLAQRVIARYHLMPLDERETAQYVRHRLEVAGLTRVGPFDRRAIRRIHRLARGNPRRINLLCDRALLGAFARSRANVNVDTVNEAAQEVFGERPLRARTRLAAIGGLVVLGAGAIGLALHAFDVVRWNGWTAQALVPAAWRDAAPAPAASASGVGQATVGQALLASAAADPAGPVRLLTDLDQAWRELSALWQVELPERGKACTHLADHDLQCFNRNLGLPLIRALNRPGIVTLDAPGSAPSYAVLVRLTEDSATLRAAGTEQTVTLRALAARWKGDFATLWRVPPGYTGRPEDGWRGPVLSWAATQLAEGQAKARTDMVRSGKEMRERLRTFQVAQGLPATGTLTPLTYMQLNRVAGVDEPRLITQP